MLIQIAEGRGVSAAEVALAWLLGRPGVTSLIVGARTEDQLRTNLRAADLALSAEERAHLDAVSLPTLLYPYWHQRLMAAGPAGPGGSQLARVAYDGVIDRWRNAAPRTGERNCPVQRDGSPSSRVALAVQPGADFASGESVPNWTDSRARGSARLLQSRG